MIILCGHIDISIGAAAGVCVSVAGKLAIAGVPLWIVFPVTILTGGLIGADQRSAGRLRPDSCDRRDPRYGQYSERWT